jgi:hypothetical protein
VALSNATGGGIHPAEFNGRAVWYTEKKGRDVFLSKMDIMLSLRELELRIAT